MTTVYSRRAGRLLSIDRKLGSQHEPHINDGATPRHAQGWRDCQPPAPGLPLAEAVSLVCVCTAVAAMLLWVVVLLAE